VSAAAPAPSSTPTPRFSVVIPTYNREESILRTLDSCLAQTFADLEVVVVDDGSGDGTVAMLHGIEDPRLVVVQQENAGPAAARNHGVRVARGEHIAFLDSDDRWFPTFLASAAELLERSPQAVVYGQIVVDRGVGRCWIKPDRALGPDEPIHDYLYVHGGFIQTSTLVVPRALATRVAWDERIVYGDNDQFAIDLHATGAAFVMLPAPLVLYEDAIRGDALSQLPIHGLDSPKVTNFFAWMDGQRGRMSEAAWAGFEARQKSGALMRADPRTGLASLHRAWRLGALGTGGVARQLLQNVAPRSYRRLTDLYVRLRGRPMPDTG